MSRYEGHVVRYDPATDKPVDIAQGGEMTILDTARIIADRRNKLHADSPTSTPFHKDSELLGIIGELTFAIKFGLEADLKDRKEGDGGKDFEHNKVRIDVKAVAYGKHDYLLCVYGKPVCEIVVLCEVDLPNKLSWLTGWEYGKIIKQAPIVTFRKKNWAIHKDKLRPISTLWAVLGRTRD